MEQKLENRRKKEYLRSYLVSVDKQKQIEREIEELRESSMSAGTRPPDGLPHGNNSSDLSGYAAQVDSLLRELDIQKEKCIGLRREITAAIESMTDMKESLLLRLKYINGDTFDQIAADIGYSYRQTLRLHGAALANFRIP